MSRSFCLRTFLTEVRVVGGGGGALGTRAEGEGGKSVRGVDVAEACRLPKEGGGSLCPGRAGARTSGGRVQASGPST